MKIARKLSTITLEEARKSELLTSFYDPKYAEVDLRSLLRNISFEGLFFDQTYFFELSKILTLNFRAIEKYSSMIDEAFKFYSEDSYTHVSEILNQYNDLIKVNEIKELGKKYGWYDTEQSKFFMFTRLSDRTTLNGSSILEVDSFESFNYRTRINLDGLSVNYRSGKIFYSSMPGKSFTVSLYFDKPTTINTLLVPVCLPLPKYISSVEFLNSAGQGIYVEDDLTYFSNEQQLEMVFHPITISQIKIHFKNAPSKKEEVNISDLLFEQSLFGGIQNIVSQNKENYLIGTGSDAAVMYKLPVSVIAYPLLRKYKEHSSIRVPLNFDKSLKAAQVYWDAIHFTNAGIVTSEADTNISAQFVVQEGNKIEFFDLPNKKDYSVDQEKFLKVQQRLNYSLQNNVPLKNISTYLRTHTQGDVPIGMLYAETYFELIYAVNQTLIMKYQFNPTTVIKHEARIDNYGNLVFRERKNITNSFLEITLARVSNNPFVTPILRYFVCGVTR